MSLCSGFEYGFAAAGMGSQSFREEYKRPVKPPVGLLT